MTYLMAGALSAMGGTTAVSLTGGTNDQFVGSAVVGFSFHANSAISVTGLGAYSISGFAQGQQVGLWDAGGSLLASATVAATNLTGQFVFQPIAPVLLSAGQDYTIAQLLQAPPFFSVLIFPTGLATAAQISILEGASSVSQTLVKPAPNQITTFFGPNFEFDPVAVTETPEPATWALLGAGLLALPMRRRLFVPQRHGRIDGRRAPGRSPSGQ